MFFTVYSGSVQSQNSFLKVASFHLGDTFKNDIFYHNGVKIHALSLVTAKNIVVHVLILFMEITSSDYKY